jgi:hypothetical protein
MISAKKESAWVALVPALGVGGTRKGLANTRNDSIFATCVKVALFVPVLLELGHGPVAASQPAATKCLPRGASIFLRWLWLKAHRNALTTG